MTAGMAEVIADHMLYDSRYAGTPWLRAVESASCSCGHDHGKWIDTGGEACPDWDDEHAAHVAEELTKAGYGDVREAKVKVLRDAAKDAHVRGDVGKEDEGGVSVEAFLDSWAKRLEGET